MQMPQPPVLPPDQLGRPGDLVLVRRARWRIVDIRVHGDCQVVTLRGLAAPHLGVERRVLTPFETLEPLNRVRRPRLVRGRRWRPACRALLAAEGPPAS